MNSKTPPVRNEGNSPNVLAMIAVAAIVLSASVLLWVFLVGWFAIPAVPRDNGIEKRQVAIQPDDESSLEEGPSELPPAGGSRVEEVIEQPAQPEADARAVPVEEPAASSAPSVASASPPTASGAESKDNAADKKDYLSLLPPFETVGVKTNGGPVRRSVSFSGEEHQFGIWAQPNEDAGTAQVSFLLKDQFTGLRGKAGICDAPADAAIGDSAGPSGVFRIYGDGNLLWESDSPVGFGAVEQFEIDVKGIELLALTVESDSPAESSRFAWGNLELTRDEE
jgi:hypothetical protein